MNGRVPGQLAIGIVTLLAGATCAYGQLSATPSSVVFAYAPGTTVTQNASITISATVQTPFTLSVSPTTLANDLLVPASGQTGRPINIQLRNPNFYTTT